MARRLLARLPRQIDGGIEVLLTWRGLGGLRLCENPAVQPTQLYETVIHNRDTGESFVFVTVPRRSVVEMPEDAAGVTLALGVEEARRVDPAEPWAVPFLIDALMGRGPEYPWILEPPWIPRPGERRQGEAPSPFAQYLTYEPVIPFEQSPLDAVSLTTQLTPWSGASATVGFFMAHPLMIVLVPAGIIIGYAVRGAGRGIGEGLQIGLRAKVLKLMGEDDQDES